MNKPTTPTGRRKREKAVRSFYVRLDDGDIEGVSVVHLRDHTRIAVYERGAALPLLHATLCEVERHLLIKALEECMPLFQPDLVPAPVSPPDREHASDQA